MRYGDRIIIDRKTGEVLQLEEISPSGLERGVQIMAKALVNSLLQATRQGPTAGSGMAASERSE